MMRWFLNAILVLAGLPLVGTTFVLIGSFTSIMRDDFNGPARFYLFALWLCFLVLFAFAYVVRTRWLERCGIYKSWSNFEAYLKENHWHAPVPEEEKTEFLSWAGLSEEKPAQFRKTMRALYDRIQAGADTEEQRRSYIKCLAWYVEGWPVHEDRCDCYGNDDWDLTTRDA